MKLNYTDPTGNLKEKTWCNPIGHVEQITSVVADSNWPKNDPCKSLMAPMVVTHGQWHDNANGDKCAKDIADSGWGCPNPKRKTNCQPPHSSSYWCTCNYVTWDGTSLTACCQNKKGEWGKSTLNFAKDCVNRQCVENNNGKLECPRIPSNYKPKIKNQNNTDLGEVCTFYGDSGSKTEINNLEYECKYTKDGNNWQIQGSHLDVTKCAESGAELYWPQYNYSMSNNGRLECKKNGIGLKDNEGYLKILLQEADTFIHCNNDGKCSLDFYRDDTWYKEKIFESAEGLVAYVNINHPMNANGFEVVYGSENNTDNGYIYAGNSNTYSEEDSRDTIWTKLDETCKVQWVAGVRQLWLCNTQACTNDSNQHTRLLRGPSASFAGFREYATMQTDGNLVNNVENGIVVDSERQYTGFNLNDSYHQYSTLHLERTNDGCILQIVRGTHKYKRARANGPNKEAVWE
jgi:hypothetical protein